MPKKAAKRKPAKRKAVKRKTPKRKPAKKRVAKKKADKAPKRKPAKKRVAKPKADKAPKEKKVRRPRVQTEAMERGQSAIKLISAEAKRLQESNPNAKWSSLIAIASASYREGRI